MWLANVNILEQKPAETVVRIDFESDEQMKKVHIMSGELVEQGQWYLMLCLRQNDSLLINEKVVLWWNHKERCFVRQ